jgi:HlyD family secretion protein
MLRLDDAQTRAELSIVKTQLIELAARQARLIAERDNQDELIFEPAFSAEFALISSGERRLFDGNRRNRQNQKQQLQYGISQLEEELGSLDVRWRHRAASSLRAQGGCKPTKSCVAAPRAQSCCCSLLGSDR